MKINKQKMFSFLVLAVSVFSFSALLSFQNTEKASAVGQIGIEQNPTITIPNEYIYNGYANAKLTPDGQQLIATSASLHESHRINLDGSMDSTFSPQVPQSSNPGYFYRFEVQQDGKVLVISDNKIYRLNTDGSPDSSFSPVEHKMQVPTGYSITGITLQDDGKMVVTENGGTGAGYYRINPDGSLDTTFCTANSDNICKLDVLRNVDSAAVVFHNGTLVLSYHNYTSFEPSFFILDSSGLEKLDLMDSGLYNDVYGQGYGAFYIQDDGKIVIEESAGAGLGKKISRLNADGTPDTTFNAQSSMAPYPETGYSGILEDSNGNIIVLRTNPDTIKQELVLLDGTDGSLIEAYEIPDGTYGYGIELTSMGGKPSIQSCPIPLVIGVCNGDREIRPITITINSTTPPASTDSDGDGSSDATEDGAPNGGDINNDGTKDKNQSNIKTMVNGVTGGYGALIIEDKCADIKDFSYAQEDSVNPDASYDYQIGLHSFKLQCANPGDSAKVTVIWDKQYDTSNWKYRKYNSITKQYSDISSLVSYGTINLPGGSLTTSTYTVQDGGLLDEDASANGYIVDPSGPAVVAGSNQQASGINKPARPTLANTGQSLKALTVLSVLSVSTAAYLKLKNKTKQSYRRR